MRLPPIFSPRGGPADARALDGGHHRARHGLRRGRPGVPPARPGGVDRRRGRRAPRPPFQPARRPVVSGTVEVGVKVLRRDPKRPCPALAARAICGAFLGGRALMPAGTAHRGQHPTKPSPSEGFLGCPAASVLPSSRLPPDRPLPVLSAFQPARRAPRSEAGATAPPGAEGARRAMCRDNNHAHFVPKWDLGVWPGADGGMCLGGNRPLRFGSQSGRDLSRSRRRVLPLSVRKTWVCPHLPSGGYEMEVLPPAKPKPKRRTPIEIYIEDGPALDRRRKYEAEQVKLGIIRCTVRCHKDDCETLKKYAARLLAKRAVKV